ncbi:hypothetical protein CN228_20520 [Pseudomonas syringae pv. actinidiae str. Shaanxi_M228]|nr:hypothetical protein CN228_20520 [Pseudomonas syringae pv. actinidiae str. Shaanxi_M228]
MPAVVAATAGLVSGGVYWPMGSVSADSTTLGHSAHDHLDTHSKLTWTPAPRPLGQAVGAQRRRFALLV